MRHVDLSTGAWYDADDDGGVADGWGGPITALRALRNALGEVPHPVFLVTGALGGVGAPGLARTAAVGVSPLSGRVAETRAEGPFAAGMRRAGITGLALHGSAPAPTVVVVAEDAVRLEPAADLRGQDTGPATDALARRYGGVAAVIGPAGERGVPYASVVTCRDHPLPRLGFGALLGSRNIKAVVCTGTAQPPVADRAALARVASRYGASLPHNPLASWQKAEPGFGVWRGEPGYATVANFRDTIGRSGLDPALAPVPQRVAACPGCPTDCVKVYDGGALHQEALAMTGGFTVNARCHQAGLDPVSFGARLAAADVPPTATLVDDIAHGRRALPDPIDELMAVNGVELPPFDPRVQPNLGLAYAASPIGPRYDIVEHDLDFLADGLEYCFDEVRSIGIPVPRAPGELDPAGTATLMRLWSGLDALSVCLFAATPTRPLLLAEVAALVEAVTGETPDVLALGDRRLRLMDDINRGLGVPATDTLPDRFFDEPIRAGPWTGQVLDRTRFAVALSALRADLYGNRDSAADGGDGRNE